MRRVSLIASLLLGLTVLGTACLKFITGADWFDCLYFAVITLTTVGYGETIPLGTGGRLFVVVYLIAGIGVFTFSAFSLGQWLLSAEMGLLLERRRVESQLSRIRDHYIVCGHGRMGHTICMHLHARQKPFVVVDIDEDRLKASCQAQSWLYIVGDATDDQVLKTAGIERARALAAVLPTDADNVYIVLTARLLASKLQIIARASEEKAVAKLEQAGANRVVSPFSTGAMKIARFMLNPNVEDFLEIADQTGKELELADVQIAPHSPYVGKKLAETGLREQGVMVIGIRRANGERLMPPPGTAVIQAGDCLFAFGSAESVNRMIGQSLDRSL